MKATQELDYKLDTRVNVMPKRNLLLIRLSEVNTFDVLN